MSQPNDRGIFRYWAGDRRWWGGRRYRWADPMAVYAALDATGEWAAAFDRAVSKADARLMPDDPIAVKAKAARDAAGRELAAAARTAFGLAPFDGTGDRPRGLTDGECVTLLVRFLSFCMALGDRNRPFPTRPSPASNSPTA